MQNLLLGLGTALVAIALIVFTAVNWRRLDATFQGLVLVGLTVGAALASRVSKRREMPASAEALGLVAVLLALADVHAFRVGLAPGADASLWWAGGLTLVSALGWSLGQGGVRSPRVAVSVLAQWPLILVLDAIAGSSGADLPAPLVQGALVAQGAVVVLAAARLANVPRWGRILGSAHAVLWAAALTLGLVFDTLDGTTSPYELSLGLLLAGGLSVLLAWLRSGSEPQRSVGLLAGSVLVLAAAAVAAIPAYSGQGSLAALSLAAAVLAVVSLRLPARWGQVPGAVAVSGLLVGSAVLLASVSAMLVAASRVADRAWDLDGARRAAAFQLSDAPGAGTAVILAHLLSLGIVLVGSWRVLRLEVRAAAAATLGLVVVAVAPLVVPLSIAAAALTGTAVSLLAAATGWLLRRQPVGLVASFGVAAAAFAWSLAWGLATPALTVGVLAGGVLAALAVTVAAVQGGRSELALVAAGWCAAALAAVAGTAVGMAGGAVPVAWAAAGAAGALVSVLAVLLLDPDDGAPPAIRCVVLAGEAVAAVVHGVALAVAIDHSAVDPASVVLATGALTAGVLAARPSRRPLLGLAAVEVLALIWLRLGHAGVRLVEAYTLPLAALLLVVGVVADVRARRIGKQLASWLTLGPGVVVALAPTTLLGLVEPGSIRPLVGLVAGALVLVAGAFSGRRAAVDVGAAVVAGLGLRQLAPVAAELPNWVAIGLTGMLLLAVGATFEQRRRDLRSVRDHYAALH